MRKYYIFQIRPKYKEIALTKPDKLYKIMESIYHLPYSDYLLGRRILSDIRLTFNKEKLNKEIFQLLEENQNYTNFNNVHCIINYFTKEKSTLTIKTNYLLLESTKEIPTFFQIFSSKSNLFICDFEKKDYFFLQSLNYKS